MTKQERQQIELLKESKNLLQNVKHWKSWLELEEQNEKNKAIMDVLNWILANMKEHEKGNA